MGNQDLVKNKEYKLKLATQEVECEVYAITKVIDATTLENIENASCAKTNDVAEVRIKTKGKICFDEFKNNQTTGRFVIVDGYDVCGGDCHGSSKKKPSGLVGWSNIQMKCSSIVLMNIIISWQREE